MIKGMFDKGAMPTLERVVQFAGQRHKVLVDNIANLSTPYFKPRDLSPESFQKALGKAIDQRRSSSTPTSGPFELQDTNELKFKNGRIDTKPQHRNSNILFHDQNNRDVERLMQHLAENTLAHGSAVQMMTHQYSLMQNAISGRI